MADLRRRRRHSIVTTSSAIFILSSSSPLSLRSLLESTSAFTLSSTNSHHYRRLQRPSPSVLFGGVGTAKSYTWTEEQFELEVKLSVPPHTLASDIQFKCMSDSIDLRLRVKDDDVGNKEKVLLDGKRRTRGKICVDGTFWSIDGNNASGDTNRTVTVTIEKQFTPVSSNLREGTLTYDSSTDFDWGGLYPDDKDEVSHRKYDEAEELNVREYAAELGVDIDNIDMNKVNKTMFSAGTALGEVDADTELDDARRRTIQNLDEGITKDGFHFDINQATLEQLTKAGLAKEIVQQNDGSEYELGLLTNKGDLNAAERKFSMLGKDVSDNELIEAGILDGTALKRSYYDAGESLPEDDDDDTIEDGAEDYSSINSNSDVIDVLPKATTVDIQNDDVAEITNSRDPIDMLTVARLKEVLRAQGLQTSGAKGVLRKRLKDHVNSLLQKDK